MDAIDRKILAELQADGRLSVTDLATKVGLSLSAVHRRVRELEQSGAILGYRAVIASDAVDLGFEAIVFVTIDRTDLDTIEAFERDVANIAAVVDAERLFGEPDYLLRVVTKDLASYQDLYDNVLGRLPGVQRASSTLVMKRLRADRTLPVA